MHRLGTRLAFFAFLFANGSAYGLAFWQTIAGPENKYPAEQADNNGWPKGALEVVNDDQRHYIWQFFFSECPNDVFTVGYSLDNTKQANALIAKLAAVQDPRVSLVLRTDPIKPGPAVKDVRCDAVLRVGSPAILKAWYERLHTKKTDDGRTVRVWGVHTYEKAPTAIPPMLTIHVDGRRVKAGDLKLPPDLAVAVHRQAPTSSGTSSDDPASIERENTYRVLKQRVENHMRARAERQEKAGDEKRADPRGD